MYSAFRVTVQDTWTKEEKVQVVYCATEADVAGTLGINGVDFIIVECEQLPCKWYMISRTVDNHMSAVCCVYTFSAARAGSIYRAGRSEQEGVIRETIAVREMEA